MAVEQLIVAALDAALRPEAPVYYGVAPQGNDRLPPALPVVIVNRIAAQFPIYAYCGQDTGYAQATLQIDTYARDADRARQLMDVIRALLPSVASGAHHQNENDFYESESRAWRVSATWTVCDDAPALGEACSHDHEEITDALSARLPASA